jgi:hypothetical protein
MILAGIPAGILVGFEIYLKVTFLKNNLCLAL